MNCFKCGRQLQNGQLFCPYCGSPVGKMQQPPRNMQPQYNHVPSQTGNMQLQYNNAQSRYNNAQPQMGNMQPRYNNAQYQMGQMQPQYNNAQPQMGNMQPRFNNAQSQMGYMQPQYNNAQPQMGYMQPQYNNAQSQMGYMQPQMGYMQPSSRVANNGMHCPQCGNYQLQFYTDNNTTVQTSGGGYSGAKGCCGYLLLGPFGLLCGTCGSKSKTTVINDTKHYWICNRCGFRFKDLGDYRNEILAKKNVAILVIGIIVFITFSSLLFVALDEAGEMDWFQIILWLSNFFFLIMLVVGIRKVGNDEREMDDLMRKVL